MYKIILCTLFSQIYGLTMLDGNSSKPMDNTNRILGGTEAPEGRFPYQVSLRYKRGNQHFCGGSILNKRWILSAAHCTYRYDKSIMTAVVGTNSLSNGGDFYSLETIKYFNFDNQTAKRDICLIKVTKDIVFSNKVKPIPLPDRNTGDNVNVILSGWGYTSYSGTTPDKLQMINLRTVSLQRCRSRTRQIGRFVVTNENICTYTKSGEGFCRGDSGGPLVQGNSVVGIVSWGSVKCAEAPDVYTRVYSYRNLILNNIKV